MNTIFQIVDGFSVYDQLFEWMITLSNSRRPFLNREQPFCFYVHRGRLFIAHPPQFFICSRLSISFNITQTPSLISSTTYFTNPLPC